MSILCFYQKYLTSLPIIKAWITRTKNKLYLFIKLFPSVFILFLLWNTFLYFFMLFDSRGWFPCLGWSSRLPALEGDSHADGPYPAVQPCLSVRLSAFVTGPQSILFFPAPSGWGWDQTCQCPEGGSRWAPDWGWQEARLQVAALLEAHRHGPVGPAGYRSCQSQTIWRCFLCGSGKSWGSRRAWKLPCGGQAAPRWWHSFLRGVCAQPLHADRAWAALQAGASHKPNRPLSQTDGAPFIYSAFCGQALERESLMKTVSVGYCPPGTRQHELPEETEVLQCPAVGEPKIASEVSGKDHKHL